MNKSIISLIIAGALVSTGIMISFYSAKLSLEDISMEEIKVSSGESFEIAKVLEPQRGGSGVIAIQFIEFEKGVLDAKILDPLGIEIMSNQIDNNPFQYDFEIFDKGSYKLVIANSGLSDINGMVAIGYLPDDTTQVLAYSGVIVIIIGLIGLVGAGIYTIKQRRKKIS